MGNGRWNRIAERLLAKTECKTKSVAEAEARKLLAKHASEFSDHIKIEAKVLCELEIDDYYAKDPIA